MTNIAQVRQLNYNGEDIGMGFNSDTGLGLGVALDFTLSTAALPQEAVADVTIITSSEDLMSSLHMASQLEGRYSFVSGSLKVDFSKKTQYNSKSTFVVARMVIANTISRGKDFKLKPDLKHLLDTNQMDVFTRAFGDSFVRGHFTGGEFYAVMRLTSVDSKTETNLTLQLHAEFQSGVANADFKGELAKANKDEKTRSEFSVHFYQKGGEGKEEIDTTLDIDEIKRRLHNFPDAVKNHPFPLFIEVATYDTIPLPLPNKEQQEDFLLALADADVKKLKYLQAANDCTFAAENPEYFFNPPSRVELLVMAATYTQLANAAIAHALALANGNIPPLLFDPSKLTPPLSEPEVLLRKRDAGLEPNFTAHWISKDNATTTKNDRDLIEAIGGLARSELNDFDSIKDPLGNAQETLRLQGVALSLVVASFRRYEHPHPFSFHTGELKSLSALPTMLPMTVNLLAFNENMLEDTRGLERFTALVHLGLSFNSISSITELGALTALRTLSLRDNRISDIDPLRSCASLEKLDISGNNIADLTPLGSCKKLKELTLFDASRFIDSGVGTGGGGGVGGIVSVHLSNPIVNALALGDIPEMVNPFTIGNVLAVRSGDLTDGNVAQFTGTAKRIGKSHTFRVHLTRGDEEVLDDVWTLGKIFDVDPSDNESFSFFFPGVLPDDVPSTGKRLQIYRASQNNEVEITFCYVDPADPSKCGIDLALFPAFGTKIKLESFDATVIS
jgi:hypothetical protein